MASVPAVLSILADTGVGGQLLNWVGTYLQGRSARVRFQRTLSGEREFDNGMPQGGILSPLLFNLLVERLLTLVTMGQVHVLSYADDIALVSSGRNHLASTRALLRRLLTFCDSRGLLPNPNKTRAMAFGYGEPPAPFFIGDPPYPRPIHTLTWGCS